MHGRCGSNCRQLAKKLLTNLHDRRVHFHTQGAVSDLKNFKAIVNNLLVWTVDVSMWSSANSWLGYPLSGSETTTEDAQWNRCTHTDILAITFNSKPCTQANKQWGVEGGGRKALQYLITIMGAWKRTRPRTLVQNQQTRELISAWKTSRNTTTKTWVTHDNSAGMQVNVKDVTQTQH